MSVQRRSSSSSSNLSYWKAYGKSPKVKEYPEIVSSSSTSTARKYQMASDHGNGLLQQGEEDWLQITDRETLQSTEIARLTTSGTTGLPKTAMQSHYNATSFHTMSSAMRETPWETRNLFPLPMFHVATVPGVHVSPFRSGIPCWIMRRFELEVRRLA